MKYLQHSFLSKWFYSITLIDRTVDHISFICPQTCHFLWSKSLQWTPRRWGSDVGFQLSLLIQWTLVDLMLSLHLKYKSTSESMFVCRRFFIYVYALRTLFTIRLLTMNYFFRWVLVITHNKIKIQLNFSVQHKNMQ